jgi:hypothetical protein
MDPYKIPQDEYNHKQIYTDNTNIIRVNTELINTSKDEILSKYHICKDNYIKNYHERITRTIKSEERI